MRKLFILGVAGLLAINVLAGVQSKPPVINLKRCEKGPVIDGKLSDPCWKDAWKSSNFTKFVLQSKENTPNSDTTLYVTTDGAWLYFGFDCKHPKPNEMKATIQNNFGGRVFDDECIKIFLNPGMKGTSFYRYVLNCENVYTVRTSFSNKHPDLSWPSATLIKDDGWSAEIAIPLYELAGYGELKDIKFNVFRKQIVKEFDHLGVEVGFKETLSCLCPTNEWLNMDKFAQVKGLEKVIPAFPFIANVNNVEVGDIYDKNGKMAYDVKMTLAAMTSKGGAAKVKISEKTINGKKEKVVKTIPLKGNQVTRLKIPVIMDGGDVQRIEITVSDAGNGMMFQTAKTRNSGSLKLLSAITRFNYYTSEKDAEVLYTVGMSKKSLEGKVLCVLDKKGNVLAQLNRIAKKGSVKLPLAKVADGTSQFKLVLKKKGGKSALNEAPFSLEKLPPKPGCEWKIDRAAGGTLYYDGKPFFPFGVAVSDAKGNMYQFKDAADAGMNCVIWWNETGKRSPEYFAEIARMCKKDNLKVAFRQMCDSRSAELATLKKYFKNDKKKKRIVKALRALVHLKKLSHYKLTRAQINEICDEWMDLHLPAYLANVRAVRNITSTMGYFTMDEPSFRSSDLNEQLRKLYLAEKKADPYRPMYVLYSSHIPHGDKATCFADCLGTDPYWTPGRKLPRGSINWVSTVTANTVARANEKGMCPWSMPQDGFWSDIIKRMITKEEQICQTYLALIHGTRGIIYWWFGMIATTEQWEALEILAKRIKVLSPALCAPRPEQNIKYSPGKFDPIKGQLPDVQASLLRYPDGKFVLLMANVRRSPVEVTVSVKKLANGTVKDMFSDKKAAVKRGMFVDTLAGRGVRAYDMGRNITALPAQISIKIKALGDKSSIEGGTRGEGRKGKKNIMANPSFEDSTLGDWPDYHLPYGPYRIGFNKKTRIGGTNPGLGWTTENPYHGKHCIYIGDGFWINIKISPYHQSGQTYVLSFYARTDSKTPVILRVSGNGWRGKNRSPYSYIKISGSEWKRYSAVLRLSPRSEKAALRLQVREPQKVYIDTLQLEKGVTPTEFQP